MRTVQVSQPRYVVQDQDQGARLEVDTTANDVVIVLPSDRTNWTDGNAVSIVHVAGEHALTLERPSSETLVIPD